MAIATYSPPDGAIVKKARADFDLRIVQQPVHLVQYDDTVSVLAVSLYKSGQPWTVPTNADVNIRMDKRDGHYVYNPALGVNAERNVVYLAITRQMTVHEGAVYPVLEVLTEDGTASTASLRLDIDRNPVPMTKITSSDEYKTLREILDEVTKSAQIVKDNQDAIQSAYENLAAIEAAPANATAAAASAKEARSWAVGDTASRPGEGMDNAKYYAALAQQVSQGAVGWYPNYEALYAAHDTGYDGNWAIVGDTDTIWVWDSDTGVWKDTDESSKFANYYDKTQIDSNFYGKTQIDAKLPKPVKVTVEASAWTIGDYTVSWDDGSTSNYTTCATVTVAGMTANSRIAVSDRTRVTDAVRMVAALEPGAGVVKFYTNAAPTSAAVFVLEVTAG
ncbi:BppU family phage baseplate upper protein [Gemmiger formicilis]|uniref:BppU family phage baseplate upper protein n=1 Tax=Gemmiger formicilis TaxID=745368 RepID=UPI0020651EC0|nr:MAG TPA: BppU domain protein [Caudoviricetes sp.]